VMWSLWFLFRFLLVKLVFTIGSGKRKGNSDSCKGLVPRSMKA
jgi:hypothetical protein